MPAARVIDAPQSSEWPFRYPLCPELPPGPVVVRAQAVDDAFVNAQSRGTQLVTTQRPYLEAEWAAALARHGDATLEAVSGHSESITHPLAIAFRLPDPAARLAMCVDALKSGRTAAALVATASVCMEVNDLDAAARDLDEALSLAPAWAAAHYERGKLWLRSDDMVKGGRLVPARSGPAPRVRAGLGQPWRHARRARSARRSDGRL